MERVFVYGTLRRGYGNHHYLARATFSGDGWTESSFALRMGPYPFVSRDEARTPIRGEVYDVDAALLDALDELEDHPREYRREVVRIRLDSGETCTAWLYFGVTIEGALLDTGDYANAAEA